MALQNSVIAYCKVITWRGHIFLVQLEEIFCLLQNKSNAMGINISRGEYLPCYALYIYRKYHFTIFWNVIYHDERQHKLGNYQMPDVNNWEKKAKRFLYRNIRFILCTHKVQFGKADEKDKRNKNLCISSQFVCVGPTFKSSLWSVNSTISGWSPAWFSI